MKEDLPFEPLESETETLAVSEGDSGEKTILEFTATTYLSPRTQYTLTNERLKVKERGYVMSKRKTDIELYKVKDSEVHQSLTQKLMNVGDIEIRSADESDPILTLKKVSNPHDVREKIRSAAKTARRNEGITVRTEI